MKNNRCKNNFTHDIWIELLVEKNGRGNCYVTDIPIITIKVVRYKTEGGMRVWHFFQASQLRNKILPVTKDLRLRLNC